MNKNIIVVLGGAVLAAVLVAMLVQVTLGGKKAAVTSGVEVLVAAKELSKGTELKSGDLAWKKWPDDAVFKGALVRKNGKKSDEVLKGRLDRSFSEGEAVVRSAVISGEGNDVVARLDPGERAVSIKVNAASMVAGFITPGSYVDVILTYKKRVVIGDRSLVAVELVSRNIDKMAAETIMENIRVLAIDQKAERGSEDKVKVGKTVTLAVPIRDAEKLALAAEMGDITLAMRGVGDEVANKVAPAVTDARISTIDDEIYAEYELMKAKSDTSSADIKIYNGSVVEIATGVKKSGSAEMPIEEEEGEEGEE
jgi:pilus assembly protein CpaB